MSVGAQKINCTSKTNKHPSFSIDIHRHPTKHDTSFLPDKEYGIALDNLVKGCSDMILIHPDGQRIFVGKRCVQREFHYSLNLFSIRPPSSSHHQSHATCLQHTVNGIHLHPQHNQIGGSSVDESSPVKLPSNAVNAYSFANLD